MIPRALQPATTTAALLLHQVGYSITVVAVAKEEHLIHPGFDSEVVAAMLSFPRRGHPHSS